MAIEADFLIKIIYGGYILLSPVIRKLIIQNKAEYGAILEPKISIAIMLDAMAVFVDPVKTLMLYGLHSNQVPTFYQKIYKPKE